jgi:hypothetical protein
LVLRIKEVVKEHSGENMLRYILEVLKEYEITCNLGYFTIDNAPNNDIIIAILSLALRKEFNLKYNLIYYRIRY